MRRPLLVALLMCCAPALAQNNMPGTDMSRHDAPKPDKEMQDMKDMEGMHEMPSMDGGSASAMHSMEGHHLDMGPHMKMTSLRAPKPGDQEKAAQVVQASRAVANKYQDYKVALADGYKIFLPKLPQKQYHFTNYWYAFQARKHFDPSHPTSLLYERHGDDYKLIGVMYTAAKDASEDSLNERIPLSIAQWHAHVNLCMPPRDKRQEAIPPNAKYGLAGSIATKEECDAAGGKFFPQVFGWMVHVYPFEQKPEAIWSVERQHNHMD